MLLSEELLSEVLGIKNLVYEVSIGGTEIHYGCIKTGENGFINIYELAHKCKQWALNQEYYFSVYSFNFSGNTEQEHRIRLLKGNNIAYYGNDSCSETEQEAIFKACQWILENKGNKND